MKKSKIKRVVHKAMIHYYTSGYTNTAAKVRNSIFKALDKLYSKN